MSSNPANTTASTSSPTARPNWRSRGPEFFRNVWVNEVVINDIEIRPLGIASLEFDDDGKATISFVTIRPGTFELKIPGTKGDSQKAVFVVK